MSTTVTMPQLGESVVEGTIAKWLVAEGDTVQEDQALVEITTDKVDTEIPSPAEGVIGKIHVAEGETVRVGTPLCEIEAGGERAKPAATVESAVRKEKAAASMMAGQAATAKREPARPSPKQPREPEGPAAAPPKPAPAPARGTAEAPAAAPARRALSRAGVALDEGRVEAAREKRRARVREGAGATEDGGAPEGRPRITPVVRKMAAEYNVDLSSIAGTGVGGRITKEDVVQHLNLAGMAEISVAEPAEYGDILGIESPSPEPATGGMPSGAPSLKEAAPMRRARARPPAAPSPPARRDIELEEYSPPEIKPLEGDRVEPFSKRRKIIAEHMVYSKAVSPHVYTLAEIDMSRVASLREAKKRQFRESEGVNLTYLHFVVVAAARALRDFPRMNAVVGRDELILRRDVNIGVAVETEQGLVVPVLKNADRLSIRGIAREVEELAVRARERKLRLEDLQGGTFTISNPGREGNLVGFAIINQPQLGILRMGEVAKRPVVIEVDGADAIVIRPIMLMSLSYDHRVIDGVTGNSFLYRVKENLERGEFEI